MEMRVQPGPSGRDERLRGRVEHAWREVDAIDAALANGELDEDGWHRAMAELIKQSYLTATSPYGQAGHAGDARSWEASRGFVAQAIERSGSFLDVGCASGVMMESAARWGAARGLRVEPYGLEIVPELAELARRRLPHWSDRIVLGNIRTWKPAGALFDMVLMRPEYAPPRKRAELIRRVLDEVVAAGGRLIVLAGTEVRAEAGAESLLGEVGLEADGRVEVAHPADHRLARRLFWIDKPR
jgi:SAM-dependent methyltransferase